MTFESIKAKKNFEIRRGPSGRAIASSMETDLVQALYDHTSLERSASAQYFAISLWFKERELRGFYEYFHKESLSEQQHALTFAEYLIARGQTVLLDNVPKPIQEWKSIEDLVGSAFQMECDVTSSIYQIYSMAERSDDKRTAVFLDPIVEEQIKAEDDMAYLLGKVRFANNQPSALLIIDDELRV